MDVNTEKPEIMDNIASYFIQIILNSRSNLRALLYLWLKIKPILKHK